MAAILKNVTELFNNEYKPIGGLVVRQHTTDQHEYYVESYEIDAAGRPINFHPLSPAEATQLAERLVIQAAEPKFFLQPRGVLPTNVLHINPATESVVWYTPSQKVKLFFTPYTGIEDGEAYVPALLWKANRTKLHIFALAGRGRPTVKSKLFNAPFFNTSGNGSVCMGSVDRNISHGASLEEFISAWHTYFFNSRFSHMVAGHEQLTKNPTVGLWQELIATGKPFPVEALVKSSYSFQSVLSLVV